MEFLSIYDNNKQKTPKKIQRGVKPKENEHILITIIIIENNDNKYLVQKTSKEKGNDYAFTGGHVTYNETSEDAIIREVKEELGIDISKERIKYVADIELGIPFMDIYYLKDDIKLKDIMLQEEEVESLNYLTKEEIEALIRNNKFRKSHEKAFNKYQKEKVKE
mgnify:FL=1